MQSGTTVRALTAEMPGGQGKAANGASKADRSGFEPEKEVTPFNGLANRRLQPLGHLSRAGQSSPRCCTASTNEDENLASSLVADHTHSGDCVRIMASKCAAGCGRALIGRMAGGG